MSLVTEPSPLKPALGLLAIGLAQRLALASLYSPVEYSDTRSYLRIAESLAKNSWDAYDGTRTPGYPLFLNLLGRDPQQVWLVQSALGLAISLMVFWLLWRATRDGRGAFLGGMLYHGLAAMVLFEANLITETLTMFLVLSSMLVLVELGYPRAPAWRFGLALLCGLLASLAAMVRPLFFILPVIYLPFLWLLGGKAAADRLRVAAAYSLAPLIILGGWLLYMQRAYHTLAPTAMGGYHMVQHSGNYFELLPDSEALIRDTYLRHRDQRIAERGSQANTIWDAIPELQEVSGLGFYDLSREMARLSWWLIRHYPERYLAHVAKGWVDFWKAPVYWDAQSLRATWAVPVFGLWIAISRGVALVFNALFLLFSLSCLVWPRARRALAGNGPLQASMASVWVVSLAQAFADHGDNPRFLVPLQMMVVYVVFHAAWALRSAMVNGERWP